MYHKLTGYCGRLLSKLPANSDVSLAVIGCCGRPLSKLPANSDVSLAVIGCCGKPLSKLPANSDVSQAVTGCWGKPIAKLPASPDVSQAVVGCGWLWLAAEVSLLQNCQLALMYRRLWLAAEVFQAVRIQESVGADATVSVTDYVTVSVAANVTVSVSAGVTDDVSTDVVNATVSADAATDNVTAGTVDVSADATAKVSADVAADNVTASAANDPAGATVDVSAAVVVTANVSANAATDNATADVATANVTAVGTVNAGASVTVRVCHSSSADVRADVAQVVAGGLLAAGNGAQFVDRAAVCGQVAGVGEPTTSISKTSSQNSQKMSLCWASMNKTRNHNLRRRYCVEPAWTRREITIYEDVTVLSQHQQDEKSQFTKTLLCWASINKTRNHNLRRRYCVEPASTRRAVRIHRNVTVLNQQQQEERSENVTMLHRQLDE